MPELDLGNVKGPQGKSAYQSALDAGYSGSEEAFNTAMAKAPDAVFYTAQSLTNEQQAQARGNLNAAPGGFGLGDAAKMLTKADNVDRIRESGWYTWDWDPSKQPAGLPEEAKYHTGNMRVDGTTGGDYTTQTIYFAKNGNSVNVGDECVIQRLRATAPWEWVNPPMILGTEYRTTERYLGKPVYTQVFKAFDSLAKGGSVYDAPISNVYQVISCTGESGGWNLPSDVIGGEVMGNFIHIGTQRGSTAVQVYAITNQENWPAPVYFTLKYTKATD